MAATSSFIIGDKADVFQDISNFVTSTINKVMTTKSSKKYPLYLFRVMFCFKRSAVDATRNETIKMSIQRVAPSLPMNSVCSFHLMNSFVFDIEEEDGVLRISNKGMLISEFVASLIDHEVEQRIRTHYLIITDDANILTEIQNHSTRFGGT